MSSRTTRRARRCIAVSLALAVTTGPVLTSAPPAVAVTCPSAATKSWNGGTGSWADPMRWSPNGVPGPGDAVKVQTGSTTITGMSGTVCSLTLDPVGSSIKLTGELTVEGELALGVGTVAADPGATQAPALTVGSISLAANATVDSVHVTVGGGQVDLAGRTLTLQGSAITRLNQGTTVVSSSAGGVLVAKNGATLAVGGGASVVSPATVQVQSGATLASSGPAASLGGSGLLNWQAGTLSGDLTLGLRTVMDSSGSRSVPAGSTLTNDSSLDVTAGSLAVGGVLRNRGTVRAYPGTTATGGGSVVNAAGATLAVGATDSSAGSGDVRMSSVSLDNSGTVSVVTGTRLLLDGSPAAPTTSRLLGGVITDPFLGAGSRGVVQVGAGANLEVTGTTALQLGAVLRVDDNGDGSAAGLTGAAAGSGAVNGAGTVQWRSGTVRGPLTLGAGAEISSPAPSSRRHLEGALTIGGAAALTGTSVALRPGASVAVAGSLAITGDGAGLERSSAEVSGQAVTVLPGGTLRRGAAAAGQPAGLVNVWVPVTNQGSLSVEAPLALRAGFVQARPAGAEATVPEPVTSLLGAGARLASVDATGAAQPLAFAEGGVGGTGTLAASTVTIGKTWLHPGFQSAAGRITVEGNLSLTPDSDVQIVLRDASTTAQPKEADLLEVTGKASLAGKVTGASAGTYKPAYGTIVPDVIRFATRAGTFTDASSFGTTTGFGWRPLYDTSTADGDGLSVGLRLADVAPPALGLASVPAFTQGGRQRMTYAGVDNRTGVATYDARWRKGSPTKAYGKWRYPDAWQKSTATSRVLRTREEGWTYCLSVRSRDKAGNVSEWTKPLCTTRMQDDPSLRATKVWSRDRGAQGFYGGTSTRAAKRGATLRESGTFTRIALAAVKCPRCGKVAVLVDGKVLKTLDLSGKRTGITSWVSRPADRRKATVTVKVVSRGRSVVIDAFGLQR